MEHVKSNPPKIKKAGLLCQRRARFRTNSSCASCVVRFCLASHRSDGKVWRKGKLVDLNKAKEEDGKGSYRDRTKERQSGSNTEYASSYAMLETFKGGEDMTQYLGGEEEFTHLVKGLDRRLMEKERSANEGKADDGKSGLAELDITAAVAKARSSNVTTVASMAGYARRRWFESSSHDARKRDSALIKLDLSTGSVTRVKSSMSSGPSRPAPLGEGVIAIVRKGEVARKEREEEDARAKESKEREKREKK